jgi:hypothetical protein
MIVRAYGFLLRSLPGRFGERYAAEMRRMFEDQWRESGARGRLGMMLRAVVDIPWTAIAVRVSPRA